MDNTSMQHSIGDFMDGLTIIETILRDRESFFKEVRDEIGLGQKIQAMLISSFVFLGVYGFVMGMLKVGIMPLQAISSMFKLPVLFLATLAITTPSLHFFNILFGSKQTMAQTVTLILTAIATTSVLLFSLAPITFFFVMTNSEYNFFVLLNVGMFLLAGFLGIAFFREGVQIVTEDGGEAGIKTRRNILRLWVLLYGFVGSQMAWTLRPFFGAADRFILFQEPGGNIYTAIIQSILRILGLDVLF